jgi:hypothetical protein
LHPAQPPPVDPPLKTGTRSVDNPPSPPEAPMNELPAPEFAQLRYAIARELHAQLALRNEKILWSDLNEVAYAVAANLRYDFHIEWTPSPAEQT